VVSIADAVGFADVTAVNVNGSETEKGHEAVAGTDAAFSAARCRSTRRAHGNARHSAHADECSRRKSLRRASRLRSLVVEASDIFGSAGSFVRKKSAESAATFQSKKAKTNPLSERWALVNKVVKEAKEKKPCRVCGSKYILADAFGLCTICAKSVVKDPDGDKGGAGWLAIRGSVAQTLKAAKMLAKDAPVLRRTRDAPWQCDHCGKGGLLTSSCDVCGLQVSASLRAEAELREDHRQALALAMEMQRQDDAKAAKAALAAETAAKVCGVLYALYYYAVCDRKHRGRQRRLLYY
jgi:hypothetical protein